MGAAAGSAPGVQPSMQVLFAVAVVRRVVVVLLLAARARELVHGIGEAFLMRSRLF